MSHHAEIIHLLNHLHAMAHANAEALAEVRTLSVCLDKKVDILLQEHGLHAEIILGTPGSTAKGDSMRKILNPKGKKAAGGNFQFPQLATDGATFQLFDAGGNPVMTLPDPAAFSVTWSVSDPAILVLTAPDPANPFGCSIKSTGKVGMGVTLTATFSGTPTIPPATAMIDVPAGPPATASIVLGVPS